MNPLNNDGASVELTVRPVELIRFGMSVRRMRCAQKRYAEQPSQGGHAICESLERLVDLYLSRLPSTSVNDIVDQALDKTIGNLGQLDQVDNLDQLEGGVS